MGSGGERDEVPEGGRWGRQLRHLRRRLRPYVEQLRRWRWLLVGALALVIFALGAWGFHDNLGDGETSTSDEVYAAIQLFTLESGSSANEVTWQIDLARFLAAALAIGVGFGALWGIFRDQFDRLRLRLRRSPRPVVVLGLGRCGQVLAAAFADEGWRVTAVELLDADAVAQSRQVGVVTLQADATDEDTLRAVRADEADHVVIVCGDDGRNAEIAGRIGRLAVRRQGRLERLWRRGAATTRLHVHIDDEQLCDVLRNARELADVDEATAADRVVISFFNPSAIAAAGLLQEHPFQHGGASDEPHLLIVGFDQMGRKLLRHAALIRRAQDRPALRATIVDVDAGARRDRLQLDEPDVVNHTSIRWCALDAESPAFAQADFLEHAEHGPVSAAYVCLGDDVRGLTAALALRSQMQDRSLPAAIVVRTNEAEGVATLLRDDGREPRVRAVALVQLACQPRVLLDQKREVLAMAMHQHVVIARPGPGDAASWAALTPEHRRFHRRQAADVERLLATLGFEVDALTTWAQEAAHLGADQEALLVDAELARRQGADDPDLRREEDAARAFVAHLPDLLLAAGYVIEQPQVVPDALDDQTVRLLARAVHEHYQVTYGAAGDVSAVPWDELDQSLRRSNEAQARHIPVKLAAIGCSWRTAADAAAEGLTSVDAFTDVELDRLARLEHERWMRDRQQDGWIPAPRDQQKDVLRRRSPSLVRWEELDEVEVQKDVDAVTTIPAVLARAGLVVVRDPAAGG
jgi:voltage-gated potassium channel Kch